jgi:hypothetical protein
MTDYYFFLEFWWLLPLVAMAFCLYLGTRVGRGSTCCRKTGSSGSKTDPARETLNKLYAQRKINLKDYEEIKRALIIA